MNAVLSVEDMDVYYGKVKALNSITVSINEGEIVSIIGSNGAGKTTLMKSIMGLVKLAKGQITFMGKTVSNFKTHNIVNEGIVYVPEGRRIFPELTVFENLQMGAYSKKYSPAEYRNKVEEVYEIFPKLKQRSAQMGGSLSGGEQQMLAIGRALMASPKLLLLDEPSLGLAPIIIDDIFNVIIEINKQKHIPIILVEQNAYMALSISTRAYILEIGDIKYQGDAKELSESSVIKKAYLGG
ncbi:ABC transporter ATP-binding protein [Caproiciproducens sp. CPB-2]|uniref:ABC transporter ATP-binding protein n=1 Tax=Caproiciproducens sp. CPB-2 TaxID=3030017 RepID=UPI0023DC9556|nr:ABC transporter ATP-binding protein [Caproiciproducens sp. CPB-2]MDF1494676.1 ABC transporter ATP-binding protein [Caproiciproducens sp. CPB-2]